MNVLKSWVMLVSLGMLSFGIVTGIVMMAFPTPEGIASTVVSIVVPVVAILLYAKAEAIQKSMDDSFCVCDACTHARFERMQDVISAHNNGYPMWKKSERGQAALAFVIVLAAFVFLLWIIWGYVTGDPTVAQFLAWLDSYKLWFDTTFTNHPRP